MPKGDGNRVDRVGRSYGRLTAISRSPNRGRRVMWLCRCDCGKTLDVTSSALATGGTRSCGCLKIDSAKASATHGHSRRSAGRHAVSPTYTTWKNMVRRCTVPGSVGWEHYGGRGITVCPQWLIFGNFLADVGERPVDKTIDRIDNDRGYEPGNVRWATDIEQNRHRRAVKVTIEIVREIRRICASGDVPRTEVARRFGLKCHHVADIVLGRTWTDSQQAQGVP